MNRNPLALVGGLAAALVFSTLLPSRAAPAAYQPSPNQAKVFTIRYVVFVATPKQAMTKEEVKDYSINLPPVFDELQHGSATATMDSTPEDFANTLLGEQPDYKFHILLSGSVLCANGSKVPVIINAGPVPGDPFKTTLKDSITLAWNSPTTLTMRHTGQVNYTIVNGTSASRGGPGYDNTWTDKMLLGHTYSQGIDNLSDGRKFAYTLCILPGNLDQGQASSAWIGKAHQSADTASKRRAAR